MKPLAEIETALAEHFDADHPAVYADCLQAAGDVRGELIAVELANDEALAGRRAELVTAWLGEPVAALLEASGAIEYGFVEIVLHLQPRRFG